MKRVVGYAVGLGVLVMVLLSPAAFWNQSVGGDAANDEPTSITSYVADFTLEDDGDLTATETITVDFPVGDRHGIFRFFDESDQSAPRARRIPEDVRVSMDGRPVDVEMLTEEHGRITVAKVGSAARFVPTGEHTYVITYRIDGVIEPGTTGETSQFYWNLIPSGWRQSIARSDLTVHLPAAGVGTGCLTGVGDAEQPCRVRGDGTDTLRVTTGRLEPNTPVTIKTGLDLATPAAGNEKPWAARYDRVLGEHLSLLLLVVLLGLGAAVLGVVSATRARESDPGFPLQYAPPDGIGPAQAAYLLTEQTDRETYVATLMYAAEKGAVDLEKSDGAWSISDKSGPAGWAGLDPVTSRVAHLLGGPGTSFTASPTDVAAGKRLKDEIEGFESSTEEWATSSGNMVSSGLGGLGSFLVLGAVAATIAILVWNPLSMTMLGLVTGAFAVCAAPLLARGSGTKRTRAGRALWSRAGGFRRILATDSSKDRFDFSGREELYTAYIPWAVAFGCADEWAAKYRTETGAEPPVPSYFAGSYAGAGAGAYVNAMVDDFSTTVDSAISSYQATQTSSSSGGGGFSGGGGGGGGGGGSW